MNNKAVFEPFKRQTTCLSDFFHLSMNTHDSFFQSSTSVAELQITNEAEACAAVLLACRRSDEIDGARGNDAFIATLKNRNIFLGTKYEDLIGAAERYFEQAGSPAALINAALGAIREQTRLPLFYQCLDMILADGVVTPREDKVFQYLKAKFKVEDEKAFEALEVLMIKNLL